MDKIFIDTDVIIDFLIDRKPFSIDAAKIFTLSEKKKIKICTSGLTFTNAYYVLRRLASHKIVIEKLILLSKLIDIIDVCKQSIIEALHSDFMDFEDSVQNLSASNANIKILVTRNIKDYKSSELSIMMPETFLKLIND